MKRPVVWAADATRDTMAILRHIAEDDPDAAERIVDAIEAGGNRLSDIPTGRPGRVAGTFEKSLAPPSLDPLLRHRRSKGGRTHPDPAYHPYRPQLAARQLAERELTLKASRL